LNRWNLDLGYCLYHASFKKRKDPPYPAVVKPPMRYLRELEFLFDVSDSMVKVGNAGNSSAVDG
jgi:hypothetical protein